MSTTPIPAALRARVAELAGYRCGYCLTAEEVVGSPMEIDNLMPEARGGLTVEDSPWLAFSTCNSYKGDRITGLEPLSGEIVPLCNPRFQSWHEHFTWTTGHDYMIGGTAIGRATVASLKLNRPLLVWARRLWVRRGVHPPQGVGPKPPQP